MYRINVHWSVIHGIKRKPHLSVVWNWYHFVAIAILHQPRPTDSADINTRLQLSDTSSIPPMHVGFLLWLVVYLAPRQYLNQCWLVVNWTHRNKLQWNLNRNTKLILFYSYKAYSILFFMKMHLKMSSAKWWPFSPWREELILKNKKNNDNDIIW